MAAVCGIDDDLLPTAALAVALATVEETQRLDGLQDEIEENARRMICPVCEALKPCSSTDFSLELIALLCCRPFSLESMVWLLVPIV